MFSKGCLNCNSNLYSKTRNLFGWTLKVLECSIVFTKIYWSLCTETFVVQIIYWIIATINCTNMTFLGLHVLLWLSVRSLLGILGLLRILLRDSVSRLGISIGLLSLISGCLVSDNTGNNWLVCSVSLFVNQSVPVGSCTSCAAGLKKKGLQQLNCFHLHKLQLQ